MVTRNESDIEKEKEEILNRMLKLVKNIDTTAEGGHLHTMMELSALLGAINGIMWLQGEVDNISSLQNMNQNLGEKHGKVLFH